MSIKSSLWTTSFFLSKWQSLKPLDTFWLRMKMGWHWLTQTLTQHTQQIITGFWVDPVEIYPGFWCFGSTQRNISKLCTLLQQSPRSQPAPHSSGLYSSSVDIVVLLVHSLSLIYRQLWRRLLARPRCRRGRHCHAARYEKLSSWRWPLSASAGGRPR